MNLTHWLTLAKNYGASDCHLSTGKPPYLRVEGDLKKLEVSSLTAEVVFGLLYEIMNEDQIKRFKKDWEIDFSFSIPELSRFRVNAFMENQGPAICFRFIVPKIKSLGELKAPKILQDICGYKQGLVLVTGPTGSGKSTTLSAMIDTINHHQARHIITIEDPIEMVYHSKQSLIHQREVFRDTQDFSSALRSALREDPDVIVIGELRDLETIRLALTAAETGHLVFATVHTASAAKTIDRLMDVFQGHEKSMIREMLSESLAAVISQRLVKRLTGGRIAAFEIMLSTPAIRHLIREGKTAQLYSTIQTSQSLGMQTMDRELQSLVANRLISSSEIPMMVGKNEALFNLSQGV